MLLLCVRVQAALLGSYDAPSPQSSGSSSSINDLQESASEVAASAKPKGCWSVVVQKVFKGDLKVAAYAFGLLVASTGNSIMFKKMTNKMTNYPSERHTPRTNDTRVTRDGHTADQHPQCQPRSATLVLMQHPSQFHLRVLPPSLRPVSSAASDSLSVCVVSLLRC